MKEQAMQMEKDMSEKAVSEETWPLIVEGSSATPAQKTAMKSLLPDQRYNGSITFRIKEDDMPLLTKRVRGKVKEALEKFMGHKVPDSDVHYSILPDQPKPKKNGKANEEEPEPPSAREFRKKLGWLIKESPDAVRMTITPEMARVMLERNRSDEWQNRPESTPGLKRFIRTMEEGRWVYTGETIIFSVSGNLLNGQHRLHASIESGKSFESLVAFGVQDDAFKYMDNGISRTPGHIFAIEGIPHYNFTASACRVVKPYFENPKWGGNTSTHKTENDELLEFFSKHPKIADSYRVAMRMTKENLLSPSWAGAMHYICACKNRAMADEFFDKLVTGIGITFEKDPVHVLRKRMIQASQSSADTKESNVYLAAYTIMAWNAVREGRERSVYRWRSGQNPNERFPRAI